MSRPKARRWSGDGHGVDVVDASEPELQQRWLALARRELPTRARAERWPLRLDHCFMRVVLDEVCDGRWYDHVAGRPAYRHLGPERLRAAVALAERLASEPPDAAEALLRELDAASLRRRGKRATSAGDGQLSSSARSTQRP